VEHREATAVDGVLRGMRVTIVAEVGDRCVLRVLGSSLEVRQPRSSVIQRFTAGTLRSGRNVKPGRAR